MRRADAIAAILVGMALLIALSARGAEACTTIPDPTCHEAGHATVSLREPGPDASKKLVVAWRGLPPIEPAELGDPTMTTGYQACVYDESATTIALAATLSIPAGPSWSVQGGILGYTHRDGVADGVKRLTITPAGPHGGRVELKAGGGALPLPGPGFADRYFAQAPAVVVQLVNDAGGCWTARFTGAARNDGSRFAARSRHDAAPAQGQRVFLSSTCFDGALGGLGGADDACQALAEATGSNGTFRAWLADRSSSPATRFTPPTLPYVRSDGVLVARDWEDLVDGTLAAPIVLDETGAAIDPDVDCGTSVWTNVRADGEVAISDGYEFVCQDWTVALAARSGLTGDAALTGPGWTDGGAFGTQSCSQRARLYCFEQ